jgi:HlyD family secretion protein
MKKMAKLSPRSIFIVMSLMALLFGCKGDGPAYRTELVSKGDIQQSVTATGTVNAVTTVLVGTQVSGTIKELFVDFNSRVKKGQIIAQIDPSTFESQVQQAKANLLAAQANLDKSNTTLVDTKRTFERNKELFAKNLIPKSDLDTSDTNYESAKAQVNSSKASIEQSKASLDIARQNLAYTRITSPVDGIVISRNVDVGQTVAASFQTPTLFTIAQDLTKMQIDTNIAESDIGVVKLGQEVDFTVDAYPDITFKGKVWQKRQAPITVQNVVTYDVVIQVDNRDLKLMPGMTANVSVIIQTRREVIRITNAATRFRFTDRSASAGAGAGAGAGAKAGAGASEKKGPAVWVLEDGKPKRVAITPGISDGTYTEIVSGDLKEGQQIIVESLKKTNTQSTSGPRMF